MIVALEMPKTNSHCVIPSYCVCCARAAPTVWSVAIGARGYGHSQVERVVSGTWGTGVGNSQVEPVHYQGDGLPTELRKHAFPKDCRSLPQMHLWVPMTLRSVSSSCCRIASLRLPSRRAREQSPSRLAREDRHAPMATQL